MNGQLGGERAREMGGARGLRDVVGERDERCIGERAESQMRLSREKGCERYERHLSMRD